MFQCILGIAAAIALLVLSILKAQPRSEVLNDQRIVWVASPDNPNKLVAVQPVAAHTLLVRPSAREAVTLAIVGLMALLFAGYFIFLLIQWWRATAKSPGKEPPKYILDHLNRASSAAFGMVVGFVAGTNAPPGSQNEPPPNERPAASSLPIPKPGDNGTVAPPAVRQLDRPAALARPPSSGPSV